MEVERKDRNEDVVVPRIGTKIRTPPSMEFIVKNPYACDVIMRYLMDTIFYNDFVFIMRVLSAFDDEKKENNLQALEEIEDKINLLNDFLDVNSPLKLSLVVEDFQGLETFVQMFQDKQTIHLIIGMYNLISHRFQRDILPTFFQQNQVEYFKSLTKYCRISIKQYQRRVRKTEKLCTAYRSAARKTLKKSKIPIHVLTKYTSSATPMNNKKGGGGAKEVRREDLDGHVAMSVMESNYNNLDHIISLSRSSTPSSTKSSTQQSKSFLSPTKSSKNMRKLQMNININNKKKNALSNSSNLYRREQQWNSSLK